MRRLTVVCAVAVSMMLAACGSDSNTPTPTPTPTPGFQKPAGTVAVNFTVDDTANKVWKAGELEWKGSMNFNPTTRILVKDPAWSATSTWATLYDDGPWNTGGHEPAGAVAGDSKWGVTVFVAPPATGSEVYEYGLRDATNPDKQNGGWVWVGSNGSFTVLAGATADITAPGLTFTPFGTIDMQLVIDKNTLAAGTWDSTKVTVKGSAWGWAEIELKDDGTKGDAAAGDGKYTLRLSQYTGTGKLLPHSGLTKSGDKPEFIFVFNGKEYKLGDGTAASTGVTAGTGAAGGPYTAAAITINAANKNTTITIP